MAEYSDHLYVYTSSWAQLIASAQVKDYELRIQKWSFLSVNDTEEYGRKYEWVFDLGGQFTRSLASYAPWYQAQGLANLTRAPALVFLAY